MSRNIDYFDVAPRGAKQAAVADEYARRGFDSDPLVTLPGAMEELGEVATALMATNPLYVGRPDKDYGDLRHELCDLLVYVCAIANHHGIDLGI
jgi:NTP pyrophosphatase (non-canonical NTP hydrolase)